MTQYSDQLTELLILFILLGDLLPTKSQSLRFVVSVFCLVIEIDCEPFCGIYLSLLILHSPLPPNLLWTSVFFNFSRQGSEVKWHELLNKELKMLKSYDSPLFKVILVFQNTNLILRSRKHRKLNVPRKVNNN